MVFSSSCTVYGEPEHTPLGEDHPRRAMSPYGRTKLMIEDIFTDVAKSEDGWHVILLRYFNPVGAHPSGRIGEHPVGVPNNLMPFVQQVAGICVEHGNSGIRTERFDRKWPGKCLCEPRLSR